MSSINTIMENMEKDEKPNFLWYTLSVLINNTVDKEVREKYIRIKKKMEKSYNMPSKM